MPRVHFVKKARKDHGPDIKAGDSYYYWEFRHGGVRKSKTRPRQSQLTQSPYYSGIYTIQEQVEDFNQADGPEAFHELLQGLADDARTLGEEAQESFDNMPEGLQQGDTGQLLENRAYTMEEWASNLEGIEVPEEDDYPLDDYDGDKEARDIARVEAMVDEFNGFEPEIE